MAIDMLPGRDRADRFPEPEKPRWQLLRAGLQNIWEYDDQRFVFHRGRLLLRGRNESGKTKAIEVLLPFLLDADLSPQRLDPFGTMSRPMRWNLVNEYNPDVAVSIAYVWLEFGRRFGEANEFTTIGAGLRAKRSTTGVEVWYFLTSQRIDLDIQLLDDHRALLPRARLEEVIGSAGAVFDRKNDYRHEVNKRLFQMSEEQYAALIEAMLQLRRPQLSKQLEPQELSRILTVSLPPLDSQVVSSLAEGFERLDRHRAERDGLERTVSTLRGFLAVYQRYVAGVAKALAQEVTRADSAYQRARGEMRRVQEERDAATELEAELTSRITAFEREEERLGERLQTLRASDEYRAVEELDKAETAARKDAAQAEKADRRSADERRQANLSEQTRRDTEQSVQEAEKRCAVSSATAGDRARKASFETMHRAIASLAEAFDVDAARGTLDSLLGQRQEAIATLRKHDREVGEAKQAALRAEERLRDADQRAADAAAALQAAEEQESNARTSFVVDVSLWIDSAAVVRLDDEARQAILDAPVDEMQSSVQRHVDPARAGLTDELADRKAALNDLNRRITEAQAARDELAARTHRPPSPPGWRADRPEDRPGAPLYLLCDFRITDLQIQAHIEAALEAAGLLDAWVTPDGVVLDPNTFDVLLRPEPIPAANLTEILVPVEAGGVARSTVDRVLQTIGLARDATEMTHHGCWVAKDGHWNVGPLHGALRKKQPAYIGTTARERERMRRLAELEDALRELAAEHTALEAVLDGIRERQDRLEVEWGQFPDIRPILHARAQVASAESRLATERIVQQEAAASYVKLSEDQHKIIAAREAAASKFELTAWVDALDDLQERTTLYREAAQEMLQLADTLMQRRERMREHQEVAEQSQRRAETAAADADESSRQARLSNARAAALRDSVGATRDVVLAQLREAEQQLGVAKKGLAESRGQKSDADQRLGKTTAALSSTEKQVQEEDKRRKETENQFKDFARRELLPLAGVDLDEAIVPDAWTFTDTLRFARRVDAVTEAIDCSQDAREKAENRVVEKHRELLRSLPSQVRIQPQRVHGLLEYGATWNGQSRQLLELKHALEAEISSRDQLLGNEERELFESFLSGETHEHLRSKLREAHDLISRMNSQLHARPTASGMKLRLRWDVTDQAPAGTRDAIALLLRSGHLLSDVDRGALQQFLQQRLDEARNQDGVGMLHDRMLAVLDYRSWFGFAIEFQGAAGEWKRLTKKAHGAGSGGQKAVMLHLPLFAAAAAFYESAAPTAPRLIVLDEAFAGIDRPTRGQLMGLLVEFELDFIMTSYEEWGFFEELDGLSTYHLTRAQGFQGVYCDWFIWDGKRALQMSET